MKTRPNPAKWFGLCWRCNLQLHGRGHALVVDDGHVRKVHVACVVKGEPFERSKPKEKS